MKLFTNAATGIFGTTRVVSSSLWRHITNVSKYRTDQNRINQQWHVRKLPCWWPTKLWMPIGTWLHKYSHQIRENTYLISQNYTALIPRRRRPRCNTRPILIEFVEYRTLRCKSTTKQNRIISGVRLVQFFLFWQKYWFFWKIQISDQITTAIWISILQPSGNSDTHKRFRGRMHSPAHSAIATRIVRKNIK